MDKTHDTKKDLSTMTFTERCSKLINDREAMEADPEYKSAQNYYKSQRVLKKKREKIVLEIMALRGA